MERLAEYRRHAGQCRARARSMSPKAHRDRLLAMAEGWETLAQERERYLERKEQPGDARAVRSPTGHLSGVAGAALGARVLDNSKRSRLSVSRLSGP